MENLYNWINNNTELVINIEMNDFRYIDIITIDQIYKYNNIIELTYNNMIITMNMDYINISPAGLTYTYNTSKITIIPVDNDDEI